MTTDGIPDGAGRPEEPVDWSARAGGGWREYLEARERMRRGLAEAAEVRRLDALWRLPCPFAGPERPDGREDPR